MPDPSLLDDAIDAAAAELRSLGPLPVGLTVDVPRFGQIADGGVAHRRSRPQTTIAALVTAGIKARWPRQMIDLNAPQD